LTGAFIVLLATRAKKRGSSLLAGLINGKIGEMRTAFGEIGHARLVVMTARRGDRPFPPDLHPVGFPP
jgi:hypothetical protein